MNAIRIETMIEHDGELHLSRLPCRKGDRVEAIVLVLSSSNDEQTREAARQSFLRLAQESPFRSTGPYPTRDELHERS